MKHFTIMLGLVLAAVTVSGAFARAEQPTEPARALQGAGDAVVGAEQAAEPALVLHGAVVVQATAGFETGKTTLKDIVQALGYEPNISKVDAGMRTACYRYAGISATPETFIRMVGPASPGDADLTCCFSFTLSGVLEGVAASVNQINSALISAAAEDAKAGRTITCPPRLLQLGTVVHLPFEGGR